MRFHVKRVTLWSLALATACLFLVSLLQNKADFEQLETGSQDSPWGVNFHDQVHHLHAEEAVAKVFRKDRGLREVDSMGRPIQSKLYVSSRDLESPIAGEAELVEVTRDLYPRGVETEDRIVDQLNYKLQPKRHMPKELQILAYGGLPPEVQKGQKQFINDKCNVKHCSLLTKREDGPKADLVLFQNHMNHPPFPRPRNQIWALFFLESPLHTTNLNGFENEINFTATYRRDSTIVAPYERFTFFKNVSKLPDKPNKDYSKGKTKLVAWFVSNCNTQNGRMEYVRELEKHIDVDIYGHCGKNKCPRSKSKSCFEKLNDDYMFYLAFENSNCKDYITEKLYWNGLGNDIVPVVMGARPEDYRLAAPPGSYIHVDEFESPEYLAKYLLEVAANNTLYNSYFRWKGTGEFINTKFWCRLCAMAHYAQDHPIRYTDPQTWWHGSGMCVPPVKGVRKWSTWRGTQLNTSFVDSVKYGNHDT